MEGGTARKKMGLFFWGGGGVSDPHSNYGFLIEIKSSFLGVCRVEKCVNKV